MKRGAIAALALSCACLDSGQTAVEIPLLAAGTSAGEPFPAGNGWTIELQQAALAFGPLYLCAGYQAGALCETARAEWLESAVVDVLSPDARPVGSLQGVSGTVRSWMYDLGITSLLTQQQPLVSAAAQSLAGSSVHIAGIARKDEQVLSFALELAVRQEEATEVGVSVVRKSGSDLFEHELSGDEAGLTVRFAAQPWVRNIDFDALASRPTPAAQLAPDSQALRALRSALVAGERPAFEWSSRPPGGLERSEARK